MADMVITTVIATTSALSAVHTLVCWTAGIAVTATADIMVQRKEDSEIMEDPVIIAATDIMETSGVAALHELPFITMEVTVEEVRLEAVAVEEVRLEAVTVAVVPSEVGAVVAVHSAEGERRATAAAKVDVPSEEEAAVMEAVVIAATADARSAVTVKVRTSAFIIRCTSRMVQPA